MSVCYASSIVFDGTSLSWFGPAGATWSVPAARLLAIGEYKSDAAEGWLIVLIADTSGAWLQAPANAGGMSKALDDLGRTLNAQLELQLESARPGRSRLVWPPQCDIMELFADGGPHRSLHPRLLAALRAGQS